MCKRCLPRTRRLWVLTRVGFIVGSWGSWEMPQRGHCILHAGLRGAPSSHTARPRVCFLALPACVAQRQSMSSCFYFFPFSGSPSLIQPVNSPSPAELPPGGGMEEACRRGLCGWEPLTASAQLWRWDCVVSGVDLPERHLPFFPEIVTNGFILPSACSARKWPVLAH